VRDLVQLISQKTTTCTTARRL